LIGNVDWQIAKRLSVQGSYDNANVVMAAAVGNIGVNLRYRIEFGD
jgi:translocation and assembly module TamB